MKNLPVQLDVIQIASPCSASWDDMQGTDQVRFCGQCQLNVYNLSEMNRSEAEALLQQREGRTCVRLYRRTDGKVLTRDCPVGLAAARRRVARMVAAIAALVCFLVFGGWWSRSSLARSANSSQLPNPIAKLIDWIEPPQQMLMGDVAMGSMCPPPTPAPLPPMGGTPGVEMGEMMEE